MEVKELVEYLRRLEKDVEKYGELAYFHPDNIKRIKYLPTLLSIIELQQEALEKIKKVSQFDREGGAIVMSEHYESAWLDCVEISQRTIKRVNNLVKN